VHPTDGSQGLAVKVGGRDVVSHVGTAVVRLLADRLGLTGHLSQALAGDCPTVLHERGRVLVDIPVAVADGGTRITDIGALGDQGELFGSVASLPTARRTLREAGEDRLEARAAARVHVWEQIMARHGRIPPCTVAGNDRGDVIVIRLDASITIAPSAKEQATRTCTKTFGHQQLTA
jgi:hypothetical protein